MPEENNRYTSSARDRFRASLGSECLKPSFFWECVGFPIQTIERWRAEGLPGHIDVSGHAGQWAREAYEFFGLDYIDFAPVSSFPCPAFNEELLSADGDCQIVRTEDGTIVKRRPGVTWSDEYVEHVVSDEKTYDALRPRLDPAAPQRWGVEGHDWTTWAQQAANGPWPVGLFLIGPFARARQFMGLEGFLIATYEQPGLIERMLGEHGDFCTALAQRCANDLRVDFCYLWEDMACRNGMMISPAMFERFIGSVAQRLISELKSLGIDYVIVDSDGQINELIPLYAQCGATGFLPFEIRAGMDIAKVRAAWPNLQIVGGIDKTLVAQGGAALVDEVTGKIAALAGSGSYIPCLDHQPHPQISLENYWQYVRLVKQLLGR